MIGSSLRRCSLPSLVRLSRAHVVTAATRKKKPQAVLHTSNFRVECAAMFASIEKTLRPLLEQNKDFEMQVKPNEEIRLKVGNVQTGTGSYIFVANYSTEVIRANFPYSGGYEYGFDLESKQWVSVIDGHDMRGMITRELLKHCIGCPLFD